MISDQGNSFILQHILAGLAKEQLLEQHLGFAMDKASWSTTADSSLTLTTQLGQSKKFSAQILGRFNKQTNEWQWAWADQTSQLPEESISAAAALRAFGEQYGIPEFTTPVLPLEIGELLALGTAIGDVLGKDADMFYPADTGPQILCYLLCRSGATDLKHLTTQDLQKVLAGAPLPFHVVDFAVKCFFTGCNMQVKEEGDAIIGSAQDGRHFKVIFDRARQRFSVEGWLSRVH